MTLTINESLIEQAALQWLAELGYETAFGPEISPGGERPERGSFRDVVLVGRLCLSFMKGPHGGHSEYRERRARSLQHEYNLQRLLR
ncbi:MAG: hypothetical protein AB1426_01110 [Bacillota bacterium]